MPRRRTADPDAARRLDAETRRFFAQIQGAVFDNPFGDAHRRRTLELTGLSHVGADALHAGAGRSPAFERLHARLAEALERLGGAGLEVARFDPDDRVLVEYALLYWQMHDLWPQFEALVDASARAPHERPRAPFAPAAIERLARHGFPPERARHLVALFWQLWRAFIYIERELTGTSAPMVALRERLWKAVFSDDLERYDRCLVHSMEDFSTIFVGATGTGKGAAAAAIGRSGYIPLDGAGRAFVASHHEGFLALNLSQFPESLIESELFGHRKGAFTGAVESHDGVLSRSAPHGAVFIDEIGEVSVPVQIKLLRVLQDRTFTPVGSHEPRRFSGRVLAATHRDLAALRRSGAFRDDFYYRLCADVIELPTLRARLDDDPRELDRLLDALLRRMFGAAGESLVERVARSLARDPGPRYAWPGNVRELEQAIRRTLLTGTYVGDPGVLAPASGERRALAEPVMRGDGPARGGGATAVLLAGDGVQGRQDAMSAFERLAAAVAGGGIDVPSLVAEYCRAHHAAAGSIEEVARRTRLDRRTVRRHVFGVGEGATRQARAPRPRD